MLLGLQVPTVKCARFSNIRVKDQVFTPDAPGPSEIPLRGAMPRKYVGMSDETMTFAPEPLLCVQRSKLQQGITARGQKGGVLRICRQRDGPGIGSKG